MAEANARSDAALSATSAPGEPGPVLDAERPPRKPVVAIAAMVMAVLGVIAMFSTDSPTVAGLVVVVLMVLLIFLSVPVALALIVPSVLGVASIASPTAAFNVMAAVPYSALSNWSMSVLPMFIFMGMLLNYSGMARNIYRAADVWFRWLPGGIGVGTTAAGAGLASVSGSTIGMTYTLARAGIPEMLRAGYDKRMAVGTVIVAGLPGSLIPPSVLLLVYAGIANVPIGEQLIAGVGPGILVAVTFGVFIVILGVLAPRLVGSSASGRPSSVVTWKDRFHSLNGTWGVPLILVTLLGGMLSGVFTPTEAGAFAALIALLLCLWHTRRDRPWKTLGRATIGTVGATGAVLFLLIGAEFLTRVLALTGIATSVTEVVVGWGLSQVQFLLVLVVLYLIMGMFFDTLSMMFLTVPVLLPTFAEMGIDPIWFGVFVVLMGELGMITPPVGVIVYILHALTQEPEVNLGHSFTMKDILVPLLWFFPVAILFLLAMIVFPQMVTWLPSLM